MKKNLFFLFFLILLLDLSFAFDSSLYPRSQILSPDYTLYWRIEGDEIQVGLKVRTKGWVGFGIGEQTSGSMPGGDMLIGWVTGTTAEIKDRYAMEKATPLDDDCQNWSLVSGEEDSQFTMIEARRKLVTGDKQDRPIENIGKTRIIWAFGTSDNFEYHGQNRGVYGIDFFNAPGISQLDAIKNDVTIGHFDAVNSNFSIPAAQTYYEEHVFELPDLGQDAHIIAFEQVVPAATAAYVHHFLVYGCYTNDLGSCGSLMWAWAPGVEPLILPPNVGFRIGNYSTYAHRSIRVQTHFNNPYLHTNKLDNSGVRVYFTRNLRTYDAGVLQLGDPAVTNSKTLSALTTNSFEYDCPSGCTQMWDHPIQVFGDILHMHEIGKMMWSTVWRNGSLTNLGNRVEFWDFGFQQITWKNTTLYPGDRINIHCIYENKLPYFNGSIVDRVFGLGSADEMCLNYVLYYPRLPPHEFCGYYEQQGTNVTICNNFNVYAPINPTESDPPGGDLRIYGSVTPGLSCPPVALSKSLSNTNTSDAISLSISLFLFLFVSLLTLL